MFIDDINKVATANVGTCGLAAGRFTENFPLASITVELISHHFFTSTRTNSLPVIGKRRSSFVPLKFDSNSNSSLSLSSL